MSATDDRSGAEADALLRLHESTQAGEEAGDGWDPDARISLAAVQRLLRRWGGDVSVDARAGGGATVTLFFPRAEVHDADRA